MSVQLRYSGPRSVEFWKRIKELLPRDNHALYLVGILLQEQESRVLSWLEQAEIRKREERKRR